MRVFGFLLAKLENLRSFWILKEGFEDGLSGERERDRKNVLGTVRRGFKTPKQTSSNYSHFEEFILLIAVMLEDWVCLLFLFRASHLQGRW